MTTTSAAPWQFDWKRPQWQEVHDPPADDKDDITASKTGSTSSTDDVEGNCLSMSSALLAADEVPDLHQPQGDTVSLTASDYYGSPSWVLNVTVVASPFCSVDTTSTTADNNNHDTNSTTPPSGDLLVLELIHEPGPSTKDVVDSSDETKEDDASAIDDNTQQQQPQCLSKKVLRWPGVALQEDVLEDGEEDDDQSQTTLETSATKRKNWRHKLPGWLGGIPPKAKTPSRTVGIVAACLCRRLLDKDAQQKAAALDALDTMTFLSLGMDPAEASPQQQSSPSQQPLFNEDGSPTLRPPQEEEQEFDAPVPELLLVCLCSDGSVHVYSPWKLLQLPSTQKQDEERGAMFANSMSSFLLGDYVFEQLQSSIWPLSQPQATIKLTVPIAKKRKKKGRSSSSKNNDDDNSTIVEETAGDGTGISLWDRNVWDPTVDPFTAIYRTRDNVPTHCISAFEFVVIAGRGRRVKRRGNATPPGEGGFVTLLSLRHYSEVRTLFLPFVPRNLSPFVWGKMQFLFVIGQNGVAVAIRIDISVHNTVVCGEAPSSAMQDVVESNIPTVSSEQSLLSQQSSLSHTHPERKQPRKALCVVHRFQILPIILPETISDETEALSIAMSSLFGSSPFTSPPRLAVVCRNSQQQILAQERTLESVDFVRPAISNASTSTRLFRGYRRSRHRRLLAIGTSHEPRHVARFPCPVVGDDADGGIVVAQTHARDFANDIWCHVGQGWCVLGISNRAYFICWEGATASKGAFVQELKPLEGLLQEPEPGRSLASYVLPVNPYATQAALNYQNIVQDLELPFTQADAADRHSKLKRTMSRERKKAQGLLGSPSRNSMDIEDHVVEDAIQSISMADYKKNVYELSPPASLRRKVSKYSHREKSLRLLRKCPAWAQLDDTKENMMRVEGQVPVVNVRLQHQLGHPYLLTVRRIYADNGPGGTPFYQILSWLSHRNDYFTAASVALDLKKDVSTLRHLWRSFDRIDEDDERTKLEGLLDGVVPIDSISHNAELFEKALTQLADMTIGCLTRGGFAMSPTLEYFVQQDRYYDRSRTCLVLAAIASQAVSDEEGTFERLMGASYVRPDDQEQLIQDIMWPLRCLLHVGVARECLPTAMALINAAVPDELRRKQTRERIDSLKLCTELVRLIIGSSPEATQLLLDLVDETERKRFWYSLDHATQMELALILLEEKCPLLQQLEIRVWAQHYLQRCLQGTAVNADGLETEWLRRLCSACLVNAGCETSGLISLSGQTEPSDDGLDEHVSELTVTREALVAGHGSGGLDFNLFIPALLLLEGCNLKWRVDSWTTTQSILNAACSLAGHATAEEPMFKFDGTTLMKQCALAENICAGANLIGGRNGLLLECCSVLIDYCGMSMEQAEKFLRQDELKDTSSIKLSSESEKVPDEFVLNYGHRHTLWLLDQYVLHVRTYGEFDSIQVRGKVDPVFAARVCLRTWYSLTRSQLPSASRWLASWLRRQLGINDFCVSKKRLACAALTRVLLWPSSVDVTNVLANRMELESKLLVQLSQACWNLVEAVPPYIADELLTQDAADGSSRKSVSP